MHNDKPLSILIVDDDKFLLDMYALKFKTAGHNISVSVGAEDALNKLRDGLTPDVIILDIIMPRMDGLELLETIRKEGLAKTSTIVMLTNENDPAKISRAKDLGVAGYIVKATSIPSEVLDEVVAIAGNKSN